MARLFIPDRFRPGVAMIRDLSEQQAQEIRDALDRLFSAASANQSATSGKEMSEIATVAITTEARTAKPNIRPIAEALTALYGVRTSKDEPIEEFSESVTEAMESAESGQTKMSEEERERFKRNVATLLGASAFSLASKVVDLRTEDERLFCSARILTDLRPVFGPKIEDGPKGMVVVHLLKVAYHRGNEKHQEFFVSLDSGDLQDLKEVITRAEAKAQSLKVLLKDVRLFGIGKE